MPQRDVLRDASKKLLHKFVKTVSSFTLDDFLKANVDPFRFSFNISLLGITKATQLEIEHKLAMKLENMIGDFHEDYLGNVVHIPSSHRWEKVPNGTIPGIDIENRGLNSFLQIKSKHNSMNSSSSKRLAQELKELQARKPAAYVGCGWVIASSSRRCIGERYIADVAKVLKGRELYAYVTGNEIEMDELITEFPKLLSEESDSMGLDCSVLLREATIKIHTALEEKAKREGLSVIEFLYQNAVSS